MYGKHQANINNEKALKKLDNIRQHLIKSGMEITEIYEGDWAVITFTGEQRRDKPKPVKKAKQHTGPRGDFVPTDEDLSFFAETAALAERDIDRD